MMTRLVFGGVVAILLMGFYIYAVIVSILAAQCLSQPPCQAYTPTLNEGVLTILNLVGGLISALVVAELAVTEPGATPASRLVTNDTSEKTKTVVKVVSIAYIVTWLICGVAQVIVGYLQHPNIVPDLTASAKSWLGLAVAAAYSYLGIKPK